jgi:hypothetical protein
MPRGGGNSSSSKTSSTLSTIFKDIETKKCLINKNNQIEAYKMITNNALILLGNQIILKIDCYITANELVSFSNEKDPIIKEYCKAAFYWGLILSKDDYRNVYLKTGVVNI